MVHLSEQTIFLEWMTTENLKHVIIWIVDGNGWPGKPNKE